MRPELLDGYEDHVDWVLQTWLNGNTSEALDVLRACDPINAASIVAQVLYALSEHKHRDFVRMLVNAADA